MSVLEAILFGALQALTEFLPVSSSGHLRLAHELLGVGFDQSILFDVLLHGGTLIAVFVVYRARIVDLLMGARDAAQGRDGRLLESDAVRLLLLLAIATIPTGIIGIAMKDWIESDFFGAAAVGALLVVNGGILYASRFLQRGSSEGAESPGSSGVRALQYAGIVWWSALLIGIAQGLAVLPGISRAGLTIVVALSLGATRARAAEFSFLLSIPAILGAIVLEIPKLARGGGAEQAGIYALGALSAAVLGVFALKALLIMLENARMYRFAWYCWLVGLTAILWNYAA